MPYMQLARSRRVPQSPLLRLVPKRAGMGSIVWGTRGMGDDSVDTIEDPTTGIYYDLSGNVVPQPVINPLMTGPTPTDVPLLPGSDGQMPESRIRDGWHAHAIYRRLVCGYHEAGH